MENPFACTTVLMSVPTCSRTTFPPHNEAFFYPYSSEKMRKAKRASPTADALAVAVGEDEGELLGGIELRQGAFEVEDADLENGNSGG